MRSVGFIGLGVMGTPMARNLARAGLLHAVWNRTLEKATRFSAELGEIQVPATPAELAKQCQIICLCVAADADVLAVIDALLPGIQPGTVVVDHSTVSVETAKLAAAKLAAQQAEFLDAPVSGGVEGARAGTLVAMVGGSQTAFAKVTPVLKAVANTLVYTGPVGSGQATKAVNQVLCAGINQAVCEALAFAEALGLNLDQVIAVLSKGAAGNWFLEKRGPTMVRGQFEPGFKLALHCKDLAICRKLAEQAGISLALAEQTLADYAR